MAIRRISLRNLRNPSNPQAAFPLRTGRIRSRAIFGGMSSSSSLFSSSSSSSSFSSSSSSSFSSSSSSSSISSSSFSSSSSSSSFSSSSSSSFSSSSSSSSISSSSFSSSSSSNNPLAGSNLILDWRFNQDQYLDIGPNSHAPIASSGTLSFQTCGGAISGFGAYFSNDLDRIDLETTYLNQISGTQPRTMMGWVYAFDYFGGSFDNFVRYGPEASNQLYSIGRGTSDRWIGAGYFNDIASLNGSISENEWQHVALTFDGTVGILYKNGVEIGRDNSWSINTGTSYLTIGNPTDDSNIDAFRGIYQDIKITKVAMTSAQISDYYQATVEGFTSSSSSSSWSSSSSSSSMAPSVPEFFDTAGDFIEIGDNDALSFGDSITDTPFTFSIWVYMDNTNDFNILSKQDGTNYEYLWGTNQFSDLYFLLCDDVFADCIGPADYDVSGDVNQWVNYIATYNGSGSPSTGIKLYRNGVLLTGGGTFGTGTYNGMHNTSTSLKLGVNVGTSPAADGKMANLAIWDRELPLSTIQQVATSSPDMTMSPYSSGLVGYWPMNEGNGAILTTVGLSALSGDFQGTVAWVSDASRPAP